MYQCNLCKHSASHPAFLRCQRCFHSRQEVRGQSRSFSPSPTPQNDYTPATLAAWDYSAQAQSSNPFRGGGGSFDGGGSSGSWDSGSSGGGSSSSDNSSSSSSDSSSSSSDSGSSGGGGTD